MDTIAAAATAAGTGAIGIVRLSGPEAHAVLRRIFVPASGKDPPERYMAYGAILDAEGRVIDRGLGVRFAAERSYTGEPGAEVHCHGSPVVLEEVLRAAFAAGARQAKPGEFTKRAFLKGKMDLTEAEAVVDLVDAETAEAARNAAAQVDGALRRLTEAAYDGLLDVTSRFYAVVDYPDEDIEDASPAETEAALAEIERNLSQLLDTYRRGRFLKTGIATAIIGPPNAGKSSLLNRLVGYDRAIVTEIPGTTRDTVEEKAVAGGVLLRLIDTAGLRHTEDAVEKLGVERSRQAAEAADLILLLQDGTGPADFPVDLPAGKPVLRVLTKSDLGRGPDPAGPFVRVSNLTGEGFEDLEAAIAALFPAPPASAGGVMLTNARQADAVGHALGSVRAARAALLSGLTPDVVLTEAETAARALGELTGRTAKDDIVDRIFSRFCVGK